MGRAHYLVVASRRRRQAGGSSPPPPPPVPPASLTAPVLTLSPDGSTLTYTAGTWSGTPAPSQSAVLNLAGGPSGIPATPGPIPVDASWRGRAITLVETATNAAGSANAGTPQVDLPVLWRQPDAFTSLFGDGQVVAHNGQKWRNISATPNLWEPGIFGWEAVP